MVGMCHAGQELAPPSAFVPRGARNKAIPATWANGRHGVIGTVEMKPQKFSTKSEGMMLLFKILKLCAFLLWSTLTLATLSDMMP